MSVAAVGEDAVPDATGVDGEGASLVAGGELGAVVVGAADVVAGLADVLVTAADGDVADADGVRDADVRVAVGDLVAVLLAVPVAEGGPVGVGEPLLSGAVVGVVDGVSTGAPPPGRRKNMSTRMTSSSATTAPPMTSGVERLRAPGPSSPAP